MTAQLERDEDFFGKPAGRSVAGAMMVDLQSVFKKYGSRVALNGVTLPIKAREVTGVIGPSGAGKSTLLRCIAHLERMDAGRIYVDGDLLGYEEKGQKLRELSPKRMASARRDIGYVSSTLELFPHLSVLANVTEAPIRVRGENKRAAQESGRVLLDQLGLTAVADYRPVHLTSDQRQRAALARALAMRPKLLLLDTPTSALAESSRREVTDVLRTLAAAGLTTVVVTDDLTFARDVTHHLVVLDDGAVIERGDPRGVLGNPQDERTTEFLLSRR